MKNQSFYAIVLLCLLLITSCTISSKRTKSNDDNTTEVTINSKPTVKVYLENSGSMNGYVDGGKTPFQHDVFNYLDEVEQWCNSSLQLYYINSQIIPKGNDLGNYINNLRPSDFQAAGGSTGTTDLASLFDKILKQRNDSTVSILISDCIFSPGSDNDPQGYLGDQQVKIKRAFERHMSDSTTQDIAVMVYQLFSTFNGRYWDYQNNRHDHTGERPYYIWVIGNTFNIESMKSAITEDKFLTKPKNTWCITSQTLTPGKYSILLNPRKGSFEKVSETEIKKMRNNEEGVFMFTIGVELNKAKSMLGNNFLLDTNNYSLKINQVENTNWDKNVTENTIPKSPATHIIKLSTNGDLPQGDFELALCRKTPKWAYEYTDMDDRKLDESNQLKTYGLHFIFDGILQAYKTKYSDYYTTMNLKMK